MWCPSPLSSLTLSGNFTPGFGNGFDRTNVQIVTLARPSVWDIQFATFVDWKNHMRLESKNIYYRQVIGDCYEVRLSGETSRFRSGRASWYARTRPATGFGRNME